MLILTKIRLTITELARDIDMDNKEIQRIIDDLETKAEDAQQMAGKLQGYGDNQNSVYQDGRADGLGYAATVLRQMVPNE